MMCVMGAARRGAHALAVVLILVGIGIPTPGSRLAPPACAQGIGDLKAAKAAGFVGEKPDGLVGVSSPSAPADARALVESVNRARRAQYEAIARQNNLPLGQVQAVAGRELIDRTPSGQFVMNAAGQWVRK